MFYYLDPRVSTNPTINVGVISYLRKYMPVVRLEIMLYY
jgi:hypothetical protein